MADGRAVPRCGGGRWVQGARLVLGLLGGFRLPWGAGWEGAQLGLVGMQGVRLGVGALAGPGMSKAWVRAGGTLISEAALGELSCECAWPLGWWELNGQWWSWPRALLAPWAI